MNDSHSTIFVVIISAEGAKSTAGHCIALPVQRDMINKPLQFFTEDPDNVNILFEIFAIVPLAIKVSSRRPF